MSFEQLVANTLANDSGSILAEHEVDIQEFNEIASLRNQLNAEDYRHELDGEQNITLAHLNSALSGVFYLIIVRRIKMNEFYVGWGGEGHAIKNLRLV